MIELDEEMSIYDAVRPCSKCGFGHCTSEFVSGFLQWRSIGGVLGTMYQEWEPCTPHIQRECCNCGHRWRERPLDTPEGE